MTAFRQYLTGRIAELEASTEATNERLGVDGYPDIDTEVADQKEIAELEALQRVLERYDDAARHDPGKVCQCCTAAGAEHSELIALTEEIRDAGRALEAAAEARVPAYHTESCTCCGAEQRALAKWADAERRWSTRERAGGQSDG